VESPETTVSQQTQVTGTMPPDAPVLIAEGEPKPSAPPTTAGAAGATATGASGGTGTAATGTAADAGATTKEAGQSQPTTSRWPLFIGLLLLLLILAWLGNKLLRKSHA